MDEALDFPEKFAQESGKPLFFAFEEFGDVYKMNGEALIKKMRAKFQLHRHATYMFSGSQESLMNELFAQKGSAFFRFARIFHLSELPPEDLKRYIARTFQAEGIRIGEEALEDIVTKTRAHAYYTQLVCQLCYLAVKNAKVEVSQDDVIQAYRKAILREIRDGRKPTRAFQRSLRRNVNCRTPMIVTNPLIALIHQGASVLISVIGDRNLVFLWIPKSSSSSRPITRRPPSGM